MILIALAFLLAAALFWGLSIGTVKLPLDQIYNSVFIIFSFCFKIAVVSFRSRNIICSTHQLVGKPF